MAMTELDIVSMALCAWKENRSHGKQGMQSVINVIVNRAADRNQSPYAVVYAPLQFSSMSYQHDPQLLLQPAEDDEEWVTAKYLAQSASMNMLPDITQGATNYYATSMPMPPQWAAKMKFTVAIGDQRFYK